MPFMNRTKTNSSSMAIIGASSSEPPEDITTIITQFDATQEKETHLNLDVVKRRVTKLVNIKKNSIDCIAPVNVSQGAVPVGESSTASSNQTLPAAKEPIKKSKIPKWLCCFFPKKDNAKKSGDANSGQPMIQVKPPKLFFSKRKARRPKENQRHLLPPLLPEDIGKKCLVLDLDETLVHSSFSVVKNSDFSIDVVIDQITHTVSVLKRPGVDEFLSRLASQFEIVVFTASLSKYANPVLDTLDKKSVIKHRLFREACVKNNAGHYVKDLSRLGRDLKSVIIVDNSPSCYSLQPSNAIPISSWFDDPEDTELMELLPFLEDLKLVEDVTVVLDTTSAFD